MARNEFEEIQNTNEAEATAAAEVRLRDNPVFAEAQVLQHEYAGQLIHRDDAHSFWWQNEEIARLNREATKTKLVNKNLTLSGEGVWVPNATMDTVSNSAHLTASQDFKTTGDALEEMLSGKSIGGVFNGFGVRFNKTNEADMYTPVVTYRVFVGRLETPYLSIARYAMGDVGTSTAVFEQDAFNDKLDLLLENLRTLAPEETEEIMRLAGAIAQEPMNAQTFAFAAWKAKEVLEDVSEAEAQILEDGLIDLIMHYLKKSPRFKMKARAFLTPKNETSSEEVYYVSTYGSPRTFLQPIQDAAFMDEYDNTERGPKRIGQKVLHIILGESDGVRLAYVPVHELAEFSKA